MTPFSWNLSLKTERLLITSLFLVVGGLSYFILGGNLPEVWPWYAAMALLWVITMITHYAFLSSDSVRRRQSNQALLELVTESQTAIAWSVNSHGLVTEVYGCNVQSNSKVQNEKSGLCSGLVGQTINDLSMVNPEFGRLLFRAQGGEKFKANCEFSDQNYQHTFSPHTRFGSSDGFACISTEIKSAEGEISTIDMWEQMFEHSVDAVMVLDQKRRVSAVNKAFSQITGFEEAEALGQRDNLLLSKPPGENHYRVVFEHLQNSDSWNGEVGIRNKAGRLFTVNMTISVIRTHLGRVRCYIVLFSDVTQRKQTEEELRHLANHDNLTGLPNRRLFLDRLNQGLSRARRRGTRLAVLFLDIDSFKLINDAYGHDTGDYVLKEISNRLLKTVRESDTVARLSGDEFTVIAEGVRDQDEATAIARKIVTSFDSSFEFADHNLNVSASVGVAVYPDDGRNITSLMKRADEAMYRSKTEGRNGFYSVSGERPAQVPRGTYYPSELRLSVKRGQMKVVYQPQLDLSNGKLVGCESFLRWNHHCRGEIRPADFMEVSEDAGITEDLGLWMLDTVAGQIKHWLDRDVPVDYIGVNVALSQIKNENFPALIKETLESYKLPATSFMVEVCEADYLRNRGICKLFFNHLKQLGIRSCIDQFGSHTSDYTYIKDLSVDTVKINQATLTKSRLSSDGPNFFRALVALCKVTGKDVISVGVESTNQEDEVREVGCDAAQGFLYGKPMSADELDNFYSSLEPAAEQRIN